MFAAEMTGVAASHPLEKEQALLVASTAAAAVVALRLQVMKI